MSTVIEAVRPSPAPIFVAARVFAPRIVAYTPSQCRRISDPWPARCVAGFEHHTAVPSISALTLFRGRVEVATQSIYPSAVSQEQAAEPYLVYRPRSRTVRCRSRSDHPELCRSVRRNEQHLALRRSRLDSRGLHPDCSHSLILGIRAVAQPGAITAADRIGITRRYFSTSLSPVCGLSQGFTSDRGESSP